MTRFRTLAALAALALLTLAVFHGTLFAAGDSRYPWGSDTLGHVLKAERLRQALEAGDPYPDLQPEWYMGSQMLRYYPPLPYYVLVALSYASGTMVAAAHWMVALCAFLGGAGWLLFRRWLTPLAATIGGALFIVLPDNLRVALAEGNLPRVAAAALLPAALYLLLRALEADARPRHRVGLAAVLALVVLCHAMMAAIYAVCLSLVAVGSALARVAAPRRSAGAVASLGAGIALSGWWLLPSLTGGITELDASAMTEALATFPILHYLSAGVRTGNPEAIYVGVALIVLPAALLLVRAGREPLPGVLTAVGLGALLITTPGPNDLFNSLPLHQLLWPLRFLGAASCLLLLALMLRLQHFLQHRRAIAAALVALVALDFGASAALADTRPLAPDVAAAAERMADSPGWREATLDESRLGSAASYLFTARGGREQLFGWAYQGARTAATVAALNEAIALRAPAYLVDRLNLYGTDDVVLLNSLAAAPEMSAALQAAGFAPAYAGDQLTLLQRAGAPRAFRAEWQALGIGRGAQNLAYRFPQLLTGPSNYLDDYTLDELRLYHTVALSGFAWRDKGAAERLAVAAAEAGVRVVVDLTGVRSEALSGTPTFLGVYGERVMLEHQPLAAGGPLGTFQIAAPGTPGDLWYAHTPQGADETLLATDYLGERAAVVATRAAGGARVWFVGLNLPYHAALTGDPAATAVLAAVLDMAPGAAPAREPVPLHAYAAGARGYTFRYALAAPSRLLAPVAAHDGIEVLVDGAPVHATSFERLLAFDAPAGEHHVQVRVRPGPVYALGWALSLAAALALGWSAGLPLRRIGGALRRGRPVAAALLLALALNALLPAAAHAQSGGGCPSSGTPTGPVTLDGNFTDWQGRACIADPPGDCSNEHIDLVSVFYATNPNSSIAYFMARRMDGENHQIGLRLRIDANNDGDYYDAVDRVITVRYQPRNGDSRVDVELYSGNGAFLGTIASDADWGESRGEGGNRVEWGVSFAQLGLAAGQPVRMVLEARSGSPTGGSACDTTAEVQWSPADALGLALLAVAALGGAAVAARRRRRGLP